VAAAAAAVPASDVVDEDDNDDATAGAGVHRSTADISAAVVVADDAVETLFAFAAESALSF